MAIHIVGLNLCMLFILAFIEPAFAVWYLMGVITYVGGAYLIVQKYGPPPYENRDKNPSDSTLLLVMVVTVILWPLLAIVWWAVYQIGWED